MLRLDCPCQAHVSTRLETFDTENETFEELLDFLKSCQVRARLLPQREDEEEAPKLHVFFLSPVSLPLLSATTAVLCCDVLCCAVLCCAVLCCDVLQYGPK